MGGITSGHRVGRYELVQLLGEGGMGTVWLAHPFDDPDQLYAVKTVSAQYATDQRVCAMFVKEASLAAAIDHPNVVRLFDVGIHVGVPFFVMEWVDGFSLRKIAQRVVETGERVPPSIALRIASDMCGGLHAAHELCGDDGEHLELVHRDVSPHNVLVTPEGVAKLIDFGVAKARDLASNTAESVSGGLKGKVRYMAPEQALEKEIDRRADLFSVGAVIYQLLTGRAPFEGPNELAIINALLSTNPVFVPDNLPEPVQWILRRALARRPENRFADAAEMQNAIELALVELGEPDTHEDVAACLAWFDPPEEREENTQLHRPTIESGHDLATDVHTPNHSPPPLAFSRPAGQSIPPGIPARQSSLVDDGELGRQRTHANNAGSWRFILLAAAFVGLLGIGAAFLAKEPSSTKSGQEPSSDTDPPPTIVSVSPTSTATATPTGASTTTPIIDMGDLEDKESKDPRRPTVRKRRTPAPPPPPPASTTAAPAKIGDPVGGVKVWK